MRGVRLAALLATLTVLLTLVGCTTSQPTAEAPARPKLPQLIQITIIPEATASPAATPTPTFPAPTITPTPGVATPEPTSVPLAISPARVTSFEVRYGEGVPVPVTLIVRGVFVDQCSEIGRVAQARTATGLAVGLYTTRPTKMICRDEERPFEIEVPLDIAGLDVGTYPLTVNGVAGTLELKMGMVETHNPDLLCATATDKQKQARIDHGDEAYCFLYPSDYRIYESAEGVMVSARPRSDVPVPLIGEVRIASLGPAGDLTARQWAEKDLGDRVQDVEPDDWSEGTFAKQPAIIVATVPGDEPTRQVYLVHEGTAYRIVFAPKLQPGAGEQAELAN